LQEQHLGWIVPNDREKLREALEVALCLSDPKRDDIARRARSYVLDRFTWPPLVERYRKTYEWLLAESSGAPEWVEY
jgi:glycosyltransferase involved in cell wall biosynthesis